MSLDLAVIDEVMREIEEHNAFCMVGFNRRFDTNFMRVKKAIVDGEVGTVNMVHIVSRDPGPPPLAYIAVSGGLHNDMAVRSCCGDCVRENFRCLLKCCLGVYVLECDQIHDFDVARWLVDAELEEVYTHGSCRVDPEIGKAGDIDTSLCMLRFTNGVVVTIDNCRKASYGYDQVCSSLLRLLLTKRAFKHS